MTADQDLRLLDQNPSLARLSSDERAHLAAAMVPRELRAGEVIWRIGKVPEEPGLMLVVRGEVSVAHNARTGAVPASRTVGPGALFGESLLHERGPSALGARCVTPARVLLLPRERFTALARDIPRLDGATRDLATLRALEPEVLASMRRSALARHFSPRALAALCDLAEIVRPEADAVMLRQGDEGDGFFYVIAGALRVSRREHDTEVLVDTLHAGDVFGDVALVTDAPQPTTVTAWGNGVRIARVQAASYRRMLDASQTHRRSLRAPEMPSLAPAAVDAPRMAETRLLLASVRAHLGVLATHVAEALATDHGDHVLVVNFHDGDGDATHPVDDGHVARLTVHTRDADAGAKLDALLARHGSRFDYVLLDATGRGEALVASIARRVDRAVHLTRDTYAPLPTGALGDTDVLHALMLGTPSPAADDATTMPSMHSGTVRLRLDLDTLARRPDLRLEALLPHERESVRRLARALSDRRVGVALGGGGAWGFAHIALLRAMRDAGVPVDLVAGCSFGALVGAYWCARGDEGVERLMARAGALRGAVLRSFVSSRAVQRFVDDDLHGALLEELEVPLFPVATDVATGTQRPIKAGPVGRGVRASGAFPLTFSPVTSTGYRLVDGGIINNVPEDVLVQEGADLVVASNVVSQPSPMEHVPQPMFPGTWGRMLHELNPLGRVSDMVRSTLILMHSAGSRDAHLADVTYNAAPSSVAPWDFHRGHDVLRDAAPGVAETLPHILAAWERIARPAALRQEAP